MPTLPSLVCEWIVADQPKQLRVRLDAETLRLAAELQALLREADKPSSLEAVISLAIEELHAEMASG